MNEIKWVTKKFDELTPHELYTVLRLRTAVFVVEQQCIFQDMDDKDQFSYHLLGWQNDELAAYTRLVPPGTIYSEPSIGRVVTSPSARGKGAGRALMLASIRETVRLFGNQPVRIGAQLYLQKFYSELGFLQVSDTYIEDGIPHIEMVLPAEPS
jgi:ElaA protein